MSQPWRLEFELHGLPTCGSKRERMHWRRLNDENKRWYRDVAFIARAAIVMQGREPLEAARVFYTRCSSMQPDQTNLAASFKGVEDGLVRAGVLADDAPKFVQNEYLWSYAPPSKGRIRVVVEEVLRAPRGLDCHG